MLVGAVGLLALGKPVTGGKRFPDDFTLTLPGIKSRGLAQVRLFCLQYNFVCMVVVWA